MKIEIKCRFSGSVLFSHEAEGNTIKLTVEAAVKAGAYLAGANLAGAYLAGAYLAGAYLAGAYLAGAYLAGANLAGANLAGANLAGAYLDGAYLDGAYLDDNKKLIGDRPIFQIGQIGSRSAYLVAYITDSGIQIKAGCFFGTFSKFAEKVTEEHGNNKHAQEYAAAIKLIETHAAIWTPSEAQEQQAESEAAQ